MVIKNPDQLSLEEIETRLIKSFLPDKLFIASQVSIPEKFLFFGGSFTNYDPCYHEFDSVELCWENPTHFRKNDL